MSHFSYSAKGRGSSRPLHRRRRATSFRPEALCLESRIVLSFSSPLGFPTGGRVPQQLAVGDVNGDGRPDLVVTNRPGNPDNNICILLNQGAGAFALTAGYPSRGGHLTLGDVNSDGKLDILTSSSDGISLLLGSGDGTFQAARDIPVPG